MGEKAARPSEKSKFDQELGLNDSSAGFRDEFRGRCGGATGSKQVVDQ